MSTIHFNDSLKAKNLWPEKTNENWKYFNFKNFELSTNSIELNAFQPKIIFTESTDHEIKITNSDIFISSNLKDLIKVSIIKSCSIKNSESKLDFRMTSLNLENVGIKIFIQDQKKLNINLVYENSILESSLNPLVVLDIKNSEVNIFESDMSESKTLLCLHSQIILNHSKLNHVFVMGYQNSKIINSEVSLENQSHYNQASFMIKNQFLRFQQNVALRSEKCEAHLASFNISDEKTFSELRTEVLHLEPKSISRQLFKTIVSDESQSVFNGRVFVDSKAQKTDSAQLCQGLILSPRAEINAKPELEIYADDVKASHGAAIGQLGKDQIFYLVSRGISPEMAYKILAHAFAGEVISKIESLETRKKCQNILEHSSGAIFEKLAESYRS